MQLRKVFERILSRQRNSVSVGDPPRPVLSKPIQARPVRTLKAIVLLIALTASVQTVLVFLSSSVPLEVLAPSLIASTCWGLLLMMRLGHQKALAPVMIGVVLLAAVIGILTFGSVRTAASVLFVAAIAGAGIFLSLRAMIASVVLSAAALGLLTWLEMHGRIGPADFQVGITGWLTHVSTLIVVAIMVFYSRSTAEMALEQARNELERRIRSEQERDRSLERLTRIFRGSPSPMIAQSAATSVILDVNPAFERCYGYRKDQIIGQTDGFLWAEPAEREAYVRRLGSDRAVHQVGATGLRADGSRFKALVSSETGPDSEDHLVITSITDLSTHFEALEKLRRSEERFSKAFNFSPMSLSITRLSDGKILEVNRAQELAQEPQPEALRGRTTLETGAWLSATERQGFVDRLRRDGRVTGYESRMRGKDGGLIDVRLWAVIIDLDGEECILSSTVNVSEEKRREALLLNVARGTSGATGGAFFSELTRHAAQALKADTVLIGELLEDQRIHTLSVWVNGEPASNFDYDPNGMPCQGTLAQHGLFVQESGLMDSFPHAQLLSTLKAEAYAGQCLFDQDGSPAGVLAALWRQPIGLGAESGALMSIFASRTAAELIRLRRDREIQRLNSSLEERVIERTAELQKLNAELDSFAYSVSHDLKSPLRAIDGFTQLLQESMSDRMNGQERQTLQRVLAATGRMSRLIADLLGLARVSQGLLERTRVDLSAVALQILRQAQEAQPQRPLRWNVTPGLTCYADARLIRIALENLLGNAVKYTRDQAQPLIEVGEKAGRDGLPGEFFVRDNGTGFDMAHAAKLFQPFQRLHMPSSGFEGTGIGLATVRRIVERHGGSIRGDSAPEQGATFYFTLGATVPRGEPPLRRHA